MRSPIRCWCSRADTRQQCLAVVQSSGVECAGEKLSWRSAAKFTEAATQSERRRSKLRFSDEGSESQAGAEAKIGRQLVSAPPESRLDLRIVLRLVGIARSLSPHSVSDLKLWADAPGIAEVAAEIVGG